MADDDGDVVEELVQLRDDLRREREVKRIIDQALLEAVNERDRLRAVVAANAQGMSGNVKLVAGIYEFPLAPNLSTRFGFCPVCRMVWPPDGTHECQGATDG